jgi:hypothetical protein
LRKGYTHREYHSEKHNGGAVGMSYFSLSSFKVIGGMKWWAAGFGSVTAAVVVYLIFGIWLQAYLPRGFLGF